MVSPTDLVNKITKIPNPPTSEDLALPVNEGVNDIVSVLLGLVAGIAAGIAGLLQNPLTGPIKECINQILALTALPLHQDNSTLLTAFGEASSGLSRLQAHSASTVANIPAKLGQTVACIKISQTIGTASPAIADNPCQALNDVYGSILGDGAAAIAALAAALATLIPDEILSAINKIDQLIQNEVNASNQVLTEVEKFAEANSLANLAKDPCAQAVLNSTGTSTLLNALPSMPKF